MAVTAPYLGVLGAGQNHAGGSLLDDVLDEVGQLGAQRGVEHLGGLVGEDQAGPGDVQVRRPWGV
ncbi:MAG: hypothetical protein ACRDUV_02390 [Pseudonocardiaceae bacterium]